MFEDVGRSNLLLVNEIQDFRLRRNSTKMNLHFGLTPLISLIAGILILVMPKLLNYIVALYLITIGLIGLFGGSAMRLN